jgi:hypothetical protein
MRTRNIICAIFACLFLPGSVLFVCSQEHADAVAEVPELNAFHEVIFKIWHEAWPEENTAMLKDLLPEVEKGVQSVVSAKLPGILREKAQVWKEGTANLQSAFEAYKSAALSDNKERLMKAAEDLHARFEFLMGSIRPALAELDDFHSSLYMLYHHYLPDFDMEKIRTAAEELGRKMDALNGAELPKRLEAATPAFEDAREKLATAVESLNAAVGKGSRETIKEAVEEVHTRYQALQSICE